MSFALYHPIDPLAQFLIVYIDVAAAYRYSAYLKFRFLYTMSPTQAFLMNSRGVVTLVKH